MADRDSPGTDCRWLRDCGRALGAVWRQKRTAWRGGAQRGSAHRSDIGDLLLGQDARYDSPGRTIGFEFHLADFLADPDPKTAQAVPPEAAKLRGLPVLNIHGEKDEDSSAAELAPDVGRFEQVPGDHHFARDYDKLAGLIHDAAGAKPAAQ